MLRKFFAFVLTFAILFSVIPYVGVLAEDVRKISGLNPDYWIEGETSQYTVIVNNSEVSTEGIYLEPGQKILLPLTAEMFTDGDGIVMSEYSDELSRENLSGIGFDAKCKVIAGNAALSKVSVSLPSGKSNDVCISVQTNRDFPYTKEMEFEYQVYLTIDGKKQPETEITLSGVVSNPIIPIGSSEDYVDLSNGVVAEATSYNKGVTVDLGNDLVITTNLYENTRYYGVTEVEYGSYDSPIYQVYPEIVMVYSLTTIGLKQDSRPNVHFNLPEKYYVYDSEGIYLGTTDKAVRYSKVYYLSEKNLMRIDMNELY